MTEALTLLAGLGGLSGIATLITALANLRNTNKTVAQFQNNGGKSIKDTLDRIETKVGRMEGEMTELKHEVKANTARIECTNATAQSEHTRIWNAINNRTRNRQKHQHHRRKQ